MRNSLLFFLGAVLPIAELVVQAVKHSQMTEDQFAREKGITVQQWNQQKNGVGHISLTRMAEHTPEVLRWVALTILQVYGLPRAVEQAQPVIAVLQDRDRRIA